MVGHEVSGFGGAGPVGEEEAGSCGRFGATGFFLPLPTDPWYHGAPP